MLTFNFIIAPFSSFIFLNWLFLDRESIKDGSPGEYQQIIDSALDLYLRYTIQIIFLCILNQVMLNPDQIVECFEKTAKYQRKTTFNSHFYDISYKTSIVIVLFALGLFFCVISPEITLVILGFFCL